MMQWPMTEHCMSANKLMETLTGMYNLYNLKCSAGYWLGSISQETLRSFTHDPITWSACGMQVVCFCNLCNKLTFMLVIAEKPHHSLAQCVRSYTFIYIYMELKSRRRTWEKSSFEQANCWEMSIVRSCVACQGVLHNDTTPHHHLLDHFSGILALQLQLSWDYHGMIDANFTHFSLGMSVIATCESQHVYSSSIW